MKTEIVRPPKPSIKGVMCPGCGSQPKDTRMQQLWNSDGFWSVVCQKCSCHFKPSVEEQELISAESCLDLIKETIEQLGEPMTNTPPMSYNDAIANLCSKRNREIWVLKTVIEKLRVDGNYAMEFIGGLTLAAQRELKEKL